MTSEAPVYAVIVAAGLGLRAGGDIPKQFRPLRGKPLVDWSLEAFTRHPEIDGIVVVLHPSIATTYELGSGPKLLRPVLGGAQRQDSVRNGLEALADRAPARVLIHDAARPLVSPEVISRVIAALDEAPGALPVVPVSDTLKRGKVGGMVEATVAREGLWRAQTPQGFDFRSILAAHRKFAGQSLTDDAAVAEAAGLAVKLVEGDARNIKITEAADFALAETMLSVSPSLWERSGEGYNSNERQRTSQSPSLPPPKGEGTKETLFTTTGQGFDVHRFVPGDGVWLCGIKIPSEWKLLGHSDADAGLHALTDAVLGAIAEGDIGVHFPPSNERWRDAASDQFLLHALKLMKERGGRLVHVDVTVICERPKVGPHREAMRARLAELTGLPLDRISVKGKTTEGLGFTGRNEGLATQAVATVIFDPCNS